MNKLSTLFTLLTAFSLMAFTPAFADKDQPTSVNNTKSAPAATEKSDTAGDEAKTETAETGTTTAEDSSSSATANNATADKKTTQKSAAKDDGDNNKENAAEGDEEPDCE